MGRRNGLLSVERGSGSVFEEGEIYFVAGRPIYASLAGLRGREALAALSRWGACRFAFDGDAARPAPNVTPTDPSLPGRASNPQLTPSQMGGSRPGYSGYPNGAGPINSGNLGNPGNPGTPRAPGYQGSERIPEGSGVWTLQAGPGGYPVPDIIEPQQMNGVNGNNGMNGASSGNSRNYASNAPYTRPITPPPNAQPPFATSSPASSQPGASGLNRRPRRAPDVRDLMNIVTAHNLSRSHRTVLLLADGEHTILDLARLSSKSIDEITVLLSDLESRGLVYYYSAE
jgi:hypothetical protein